MSEKPSPKTSLIDLKILVGLKPVLIVSVLEGRVEVLIVTDSQLITGSTSIASLYFLPGSTFFTVILFVSSPGNATSTLKSNALNCSSGRGFSAESSTVPTSLIILISPFWFSPVKPDLISTSSLLILKKLDETVSFTSFPDGSVLI